MIRATAINNINTREKDDFYATPAWCTRALLRRIDAGHARNDWAKVLDPCCGDGAILKAIRERWGYGTLDGIEINAERARSTASEYAWFVWSKHIPPTVEILPLEVSVARADASGDYAREGAKE